MFQWIKKILFANNIDAPNVPEHKASANRMLRDKENLIFGQDELQVQRLFEKWSVKDYWNLKSEAIPLVFSQDPNNIIADETYLKNAEDLFQHAKHCIEAGLSLSIQDKTRDDSQWQVVPLEFYTWAAVSRVPIPERLAGLMEFIASTVMLKKTTANRKEMPPINPEADALSLEFQQQNQKIFGAALKALINHYAECQNSKGRIDLNTLVDCLEKHQNEWFKAEEFTASRVNKETVLRPWIN